LEKKRQRSGGLPSYLVDEIREKPTRTGFRGKKRQEKIWFEGKRWRSRRTDLKFHEEIEKINVG